MLNRRRFLQRAAALSVAPALLPFATALARTRRGRSGTGKKLVVVELNGGNDGVNTVVPWRDEGYAQHRLHLRLPKEELVPLDTELGLHPALRGLAPALESGRLAVVQGVGNPQPNLSHEVSLATWHTGSLDRAGRRGTGWIGRTLDARPPFASHAPDAVLAGEHAMPQALRNRHRAVASIPSLSLYEDIDALREEELEETTDGASVSTAEEHLRRVLRDARHTAERIHGLEASAESGQRPLSRLDHDLGLIAGLLGAGLDTDLYYAIQPGYDTHALQLEAHASRMTELGDALAHFLERITEAGLGREVLVLVFSEFGRRIPENASRGTDHGTAGPVLLLGEAVQPGVHGTTPSLTDLDDGNLRHTVDFRQVYAEVIERWLGGNSREVLGGEFSGLGLLGA